MSNTSFSLVSSHLAVENFNYALNLRQRMLAKASSLVFQVNTSNQQLSYIQLLLFNHGEVALRINYGAFCINLLNLVTCSDMRQEDSYWENPRSCIQNFVIKFPPSFLSNP